MSGLVGCESILIETNYFVKKQNTTFLLEDKYDFYTNFLNEFKHFFDYNISETNLSKSNLLEYNDIKDLIKLLGAF
jgi:hypothetical protein